MKETHRNYFRILGLEESFTADFGSILENAYLDLQQKLRNVPILEKTDDIHNTIQLVNKAYHFLKDPVNRIQHLLELSNYGTSSGDSNPETLATILELEEEIENGNVEQTLRTIEFLYRENLQQAEAAFNIKDYEVVQSSHITLKYLVKLKQRIYATDSNQ